MIHGEIEFMLRAREVQCLTSTLCNDHLMPFQASNVMLDHVKVCKVW